MPVDRVREWGAGLLGGLSRSLMGRGLCGVKLVISDGNHTIGNAAPRLLPDAFWQVCSTHFQRNPLTRISHQPL